MSKVTLIEQTDQFGNVAEIAQIENEDGSVTSMLKSTYDAMQAEQSTPMVTDAN
jgi:hypothetical protein